jgi:hypothetical protein
MIIRDFLRDATYSLGGPGLTLAMPIETVGDLAPVMANPDNHIAALCVDLPFLLPIDNGRYDVLLSDRPVLMFHERRERGSEEFSTLDTTQLPYFSHLQIQMRPFVDYATGPPLGNGGSFAQRYKSYNIVIEVLEKLDEFLRIDTRLRAFEGGPLRLSYRIGYFLREEPPIQVAESIYLTSEPVRIQSPESGPYIDSEALRAYLSQRVKIAAFAKQVIEPELARRTFRQRVFLALHDFCFYCRQHPRAIGNLEEEQIRDLFLVVVKCLFEGGEGETFHFDGKLDYKIINPDNKYEFVTGELKWWRGPASAVELYHQGVRKHATGQEAEIHLVMLNLNKDVRIMAEEYRKSIEAEPETKAEVLLHSQLPPGSRERFLSTIVEIRGHSVPLIAAVADLWHERL